MAKNIFMIVNIEQNYSISMFIVNYLIYFLYIIYNE